MLYTVDSRCKARRISCNYDSCIILLIESVQYRPACIKYKAEARLCTKYLLFPAFKSL